MAIDTIVRTGRYIFAYVGPVLFEGEITLAAGQPTLRTRAGITFPLTMDRMVFTRRAALQAHTESGQRGSTAKFLPSAEFNLRISAEDFMPGGRNAKVSVKTLLVRDGKI